MEAAKGLIAVPPFHCRPIPHAPLSARTPFGPNPLHRSARLLPLTEIQRFGQSALKISTPGGKVILVDPFISNNPKTPEEYKDLSKIGEVDLILLTHGHGDHVGDTVELAGMTGAKVAMNSDMGQTFRLLGLLS